MSDLRTAAQQALELLQSAHVATALVWPRHDCVEALKAALEQPEQEPVAWMYVGLTFNNDMHGPHLVWKPEHMDAMSAEKGVVASPLYTRPPRREWRGLSKDESLKLWGMRSDGPSNTEITSYARAIEDALKERNA